MTSPRYGEHISPESAGEPMTFAELQRAVWAADPQVFLVHPRILRRVIKHDRQLTGFGLRVPHRKSYRIAREPLLEIIDRADLGVDEELSLPENIILLTRPGPQDFFDWPADRLLIRCWRLMFHVRVHLALEAKAAAGELTSAIIRERIHEIGEGAFDEIRLVLGQENLLLPPRSDESTYVEFAATYLELRRFAPSFLPRYFPGLEDLEAVDGLLRRDVDADVLFRATRPAGVSDPSDSCELDEWAGISTEQESPAAAMAPPPEIASETKYRVLMRASQRPASLGNVVRAAICHARAERCAPPQFAARVRSAAKMDVDRLICRLQAALEIEEASPQRWQESLFALVMQTPRGIWTVEARLLYDLQKVCVDHEREIYTVDLVEWALSWGRRPVKRHLPSQRDVLMLKHLRSAVRRLAVVRISDDQRRQLAVLVQDAIGRVESRLRQKLRPRIIAALDEVNLLPHNLPERVARKKMVEELLDQICERGFLSMGDLRDAISRNNLKLPDISGFRDFLHGDQLLRADRRLALALDGVYRRGEFYLRWMQRLSSLAFGTRAGRFLTRFAAVPYGGAFVAVVGVHEMWELITGAKKAEEFSLPWPEVMLPLGLLLMCLVNSAVCRRAVGRFFVVAIRTFHAVVVEPISWIARSRLLQEFIHNRLFPLCFRYAVKPLIWMNVIRWLLLLKETSWQMSAATSVSIFLAVNVVLNSRAGRTVEEIVVDETVQGWRRFGLRAIMGLFWLVVDVFRRIVQTIERLMYSVDEWLRFRGGASRVSFAAKAGLGVLWFFVAYVLRFAVNVLIEPQINPIKHFPVVTVAHKLLLTVYKPFGELISASFGIGALEGYAMATTIIWCIPGIFGFLVWELTENWRLYAANRRPQLRPVVIGSHGETMARLLKPGFHSGTLPKRFGKLRYAERQARAGGNWQAVHKHLRALYHTEVSIRRFVEREFLELLTESKCWQGPSITLERIRLGTNLVQLSLACPGIAGGVLQVAIESESGWLLAGASDRSWIDGLLPQQRQVLVTAMLGLYKTAGIDLLRQQIESEFPPPMPWCSVSAKGLVMWPDEEREVEVLYDLHEAPWIAPQAIRGLSQRRLPTVERWRLVFGAVPIDWDRWVEVWNEDMAGQGHPRDAIVPVRVLPP
jgi:hypothetical protein